MSRLLSLLGLTIASSALAAPVPKVPPEPLPPGAIARFGTPNYRGSGAELVYSADGKQLFGFEIQEWDGSVNNKKLSVWDAETGAVSPHEVERPAGLDQHQSVAAAIANDHIVWTGQ